MFKTILKFFKKKYQDVIHSIAFFPVLLSIAFLLLAIGALQIENLEIINSVKKKIPYLFIEDFETARSILSTIIGGILSLTVFSFSMVMVVLNQASSNFSPRLLPSLISNKKHQIILGFYIGTLLYCIIILTTLGAYGNDSNSVGLSTMIAALSSLACIALFVYFINSISGAIQIHNIIDRIFDTSSNYLQNRLEKQKENKIVINSINTENWNTVSIDKTGYYRDFDISLMKDSIKNKENHIEIIPYINEHIWKGMPVLKSKEPVSEEEMENLLFCFNISTDRHEGDRGITGMIKLMEITVKAMSPGINDPGTAIDAINKIGSLLCEFLKYPDMVSTPMTNSKLIITENNICAKELMRILVQPIRLYSKKDNSVIYVLIKSLQYISMNPNISKENRLVVKRELEALKNDIDKNINNKFDKENLMVLLETNVFDTVL
ncbi:DUF2254 domain-containing protein [Aureibaculum sp. A20]|uniref:DUF2254 domain-containing protein n=1 Tax=Aureibaculum flavum TaxID=2795986 RepID=A0ABS0WQT3_9FLAO|nr:DUF2254 domain-containing protein [Aureibaculum flavum]MBJ2174340.1 DUF2254 domain-containing protein [Aureibaculum flavum]